MDIARVKRAIKAAIDVAGIDRLDTYAHTPGSVVVPCVYPTNVTIDPNGAGADFRGSDTAEVVLRVLTSAADDLDGQLALDEYLSRTGPNSIRAALETARGGPGEYALDGAADDMHVVRIDGYRIYTEGTDEFFGAEITVRVIGEGE